MRVIELLEEVREIVDTASGVLLTGKIMVDANELLGIVEQIENELPEEIKQAQWIKDERERILEEAKREHQTIIRDAEQQAEHLIEDGEIMSQARERAQALMESTEENVRRLKMSTYDYMDGILFDFQEKMDQLSAVYFNEMFGKLEGTFHQVNETLATNREEIKAMAHNTSANMEDSNLRNPMGRSFSYEEENES